MSFWRPVPTVGSGYLRVFASLAAPFLTAAVVLVGVESTPVSAAAGCEAADMYAHHTAVPADAAGGGSVAGEKFGAAVAVGDFNKDGRSDVAVGAPGHLIFAGGCSSVEVGAAFGGVADLDGGHDVQHSVDLPVPGSGEPVADLVAGGGVDGGGSVPGGEVRPGGEAGDVTDLDQQPGGPRGADAMQVHQRGAVAWRSWLSSLSAALVCW